MIKYHNVDMGKQGETTAVNYILSKGYRILQRNYRCPYGEIDIISSYLEYIVFIEVKYRKTTEYGRPCEAVTAVKQRKIKKTALHYIQENNLDNEYFRFDVVEILGFEYIEINHIENGFW